MAATRHLLLCACAPSEYIQHIVIAVSRCKEHMIPGHRTVHSPCMVCVGIAHCGWEIGSTIRTPQDQCFQFSSPEPMEFRPHGRDMYTDTEANCPLFEFLVCAFRSFEPEVFQKCTADPGIDFQGVLTKHVPHAGGLMSSVFHHWQVAATCVTSLPQCACICKCEVNMHTGRAICSHA